MCPNCPALELGFRAKVRNASRFGPETSAWEYKRGYLGSGYYSVEPLRLNLLTVEGSMLEGIPLGIQ
jgi:hypothetical protein